MITIHQGANSLNDDSISEFTDDDYLICSASMTVFDFDSHEWCVVDITRLKEKEWKPETFDRLVLNPEKKDTLARLARTNSQFVKAEKTKDVTEGKGKGMVLLFHGPPGVGKTVREI